MNDDAKLLQRYAHEQSEAAFAELVRRHVDLVYSAALRRSNGDTHRAEDAVQQVFVSLARNAAKLASHPALEAWLYTATRNAVVNLAVAEQRRAKREQEAVMSGMLSPEENAADWSELRPVLDAVMDELGEPDRTAVLLRFFKKRSFAEVGVALSVSENTARMRTERAVEKLRLVLEKRGVRSSAAALGLVLGRQAVVAAPAAMSVAVTAYILKLARGSALSPVTAATGAGKGILVSALLVAAAVLVTVGVVRLRGSKAVAARQPASAPWHERGEPDSGATAHVAEKPTAKEQVSQKASVRTEAVASRPAPGPSDPKAVEVLQKMAAAYAALTTYQDSGEVVEKTLEGVERGRSVFKTRFRKPDRFSLVWSRRVSMRDTWSGCLWWFGEKAGNYWSVRSTFAESSSRRNVLVRGLALTQGSGFHVPRFFVGRDGDRLFSLVDLVGVSLAGELPHEDGMCYVVKGQHADGTPFELWIGQKDFLLRKLKSVLPIPFLKNTAGTPKAPEGILEENRRNVRVDLVLADDVFNEAKTLADSQTAK